MPYPVQLGDHLRRGAVAHRRQRLAQREARDDGVAAPRQQRKVAYEGQGEGGGLGAVLRYHPRQHSQRV